MSFPDESLCGLCSDKVKKMIQSGPKCSSNTNLALVYTRKPYTKSLHLEYVIVTCLQPDEAHDTVDGQYFLLSGYGWSRNWDMQGIPKTSQNEYTTQLGYQGARNA